MIEIISGKKQNLWRGPAILNFFSGGAGVGLYLLWIWFGPELKEEGAFRFLDLFPAALMALGLGAVALEAGRPFRGVYLFLNAKQSWMSREVIFAALFILLSLMEWVTGAAFTLLTASAGILFVVSQAMILYRSTTVSAWHRPVLPLMFITASLLHGFGFHLLLMGLHILPGNTAVMIYGLICLPLAVATWHLGLFFRFHSKGKATPIRSLRWRILDVGAGSVLPLLVLIVSILMGFPEEGGRTALDRKSTRLNSSHL